MKTTYLKGSVTKSAETGVYRIIASTASIDRQGDSIDQSGWDLTDFKSNPVLLWAHDYSALPIGKVTSIEVKKGQLLAEFKFADAEGNPKAAQIQKLYEDGIVNASSVGFIPLERNGHVITKASLLELSLVPVPANQDALRLMIESKTFNLVESYFKGDVADKVDEQSMYEMKWENMDKLSDIMSAFYAVYFDETTPVEKFNDLLVETADLITKLANGDTGSEEEKSIIAKSIGDVAKKDFINAILEKSGKRFSKKTLAVIETSIKSMKDSVIVLENLVKEDDQVDEQVVEEVVDDNKSIDNEVVEIPLSDFLKSVQGLVRVSDKANGEANAIINSFLHKKSLN